MGRVTVDEPWAKHTFRHWQAIADDVDTPGFLRVAAYAYAHAAPNGHVPTWEVDLTAALERVDKATGELGPTPVGTIINWKRKAVRHGLLHPDTWKDCLVLPDGVVMGLRVAGSPDAGCGTCRRPTRRRGVRVRFPHPTQA